ncbi:MAG: TIGR02594 family protein [Bacteroidales bacterium]|jgi:uncharacterized protein (TIGR02594 family)|nr:TIGR02594 family protein [Bacteroidales bacterium]
MVGVKKYNICYAGGKAIQHLQYLPFGENLLEQRTADWHSRYTFSGKEKDEESGYSYFGARYYNSDIYIWLSPDPMSDNYPSLTPYAYCANNPIVLRDPTGMFTVGGFGINLGIIIGGINISLDRGDYGSGYSSFSDWVLSANGTVYWDNNAISQATAKKDEKYIGKTVGYFDRNGNLYKGNEKGELTCYNNMVTVTADKNNTSTPWMTYAKDQREQTEIPGSQHNPAVIGYHATTGGFKTDETPWCSSFVNWSFTQAGITGTNSALAASWKNWGQDLENNPAYGSVGLVGSNGKITHVGFTVAVLPNGSIRLLGGNQGTPSAVRISTYTPDKFVGFRYPNGYTPVFFKK